MPAVRIAIDLGSHEVKVVWTTATREGLRWHYVHGSRQGDESSAAVARLLQRLLRPLRRRRFSAPVILTVSQSHLRQLLVTVKEQTQVPAAIQAEAGRLFPFEPSQAILRHRVVSQQPLEGNLSCVLQVAACEAHVVQRDLDTLARAGWVPTQACPSALALAALARGQGRLGPEPVILCDLGARHSMVAVAANGRLLMAREVAIGSEALTEALMTEVRIGEDTVKLSWEEAEALKRQLGIPLSETAAASAETRLPLATYRALLQPVLEQWVGEIQRTAAFSQEVYPDAEPKTVLVCGGGSQLTGLDDWLGRQLGMTVHRLTVQPVLGTDLPALAVAVGSLLADDAAELSLLPTAAGQARRVIVGERLAITGLLGGAIAAWLSIAVIGVQHAQLRRQLVPLQQRQQALAPVAAMAETVTTHAAMLDALVGGQASSVRWFRRMTEGFPDPIRLTELTVNLDGDASLAGQAQPREQAPEAYVSELAMWLTQQDLCHNVQLGSSQRSLQASDRVDFTLTCRRP